MILWYKNSFLASVVSIFGCALIMIGIMGVVEGEPDALVCVIPGLALAIWGRSISHNKAFKKWWKQIEEKNLEPVIARDLNTAIAVYNKNPQKRTLKKIATLNPSFAQQIEQSIAKKK